MAVAFVLLTLIALVLVPWFVQRRVLELRSGIQASEPARTLIMQWQFNLVREMSALNELLLSGDTGQAIVFGAALATEERVHVQVAPLIERLGPRVLEPYVHARTLARQWHARVDDEQVARQRAQGVGLSEVRRERQLFGEVLRAAAAVDSAIIATTAEKRAQIGAAERTGFRITLLLGALAILSAGAVLALLMRTRRFAEEAERRRQEADAALAESARAAQARTRLLRGITHDVKNPLGAAKGYAELLSMGVKAPVATEQVPLLEGIQRSIDSALAIIADLLDFARSESGGVRMHRVQVDLNRLVREAESDYRGAAENAGHELVAVTADEPLIAHTDPVRVRQILDNLLSNALKYTPAPGQVRVNARMQREEDGERPGAWAMLEVADNGPGIPAEHRELVFDEFSRLEENSPVKGHGLGLPIALNLARQLGGDLTIADTQGGATFVLSIPQRDA